MDLTRIYAVYGKNIVCATDEGNSNNLLTLAILIDKLIIRKTRFIIRQTMFF